jgi:hypothetical protein
VRNTNNKPLIAVFVCVLDANNAMWRYRRSVQVLELAWTWRNAHRTVTRSGGPYSGDNAKQVSRRMRAPGVGIRTGISPRFRPSCEV